MRGLIAEIPAGVYVFIYVYVRAWSFFITARMLRIILRSGTGKKSKLYRKSASPVQRMYGTYIPKVTGYRHRFSKYLAWNNAVAGVESVIIIALYFMTISSIVWMKSILAYGVIVSIVLMCFPPIVISFAQTTYNNGHPQYKFDLEADFIGVRAKQRKRKLLKEKRNGIIAAQEDIKINK